MAFTKEEFIKVTSSLTGSNAPKEDDKKKKKKDAEPSYLDYADQIVQRYREEEGAREKAPSLQSPLQTAAYQAVDRSRSGFSFDAFKSGMQDIKSWAPYIKLQAQQKLKNTYDNTASGIRKLKTAADYITSAYRQQQAQTAVPQNVPRESDLISLQTRMKSLEQSMSQDIGRFSQYAPPYAQNTGDTRYKRSQEIYNDLKSQYQQASRDYNAARYSAMRNNPDFEEYSKRGAGMDNTSGMIAARSGNPSFMTSAPSGAPERYRVRYLPDPTRDLGNDAYDYLSDDELATYNYLVAKDAEDGTQEAGKYLSFMLPELNRRKMTLVAQDAAEFAEKYPVTASAASLITSPLAGLGTLYSYGAAALGQDVDPNSPWFAPTVVSDTMRGTVSENISKSLDDLIGEGVGDVGSFLYQTGMFILDFLVGGAATGSSVSKLGSGIYLTNSGLRAAASTIQDAFARGATQEQALKLGAMAGIAEILFEKISLDRFVELSNSPLRTSIIKDVLVQGGVEASEEMFTEIANIFFDEHIMGNLSDWQQRVQAYMAQGMTESEANTKAWIEAAKQVALAGLGGFLSGEVTGSVASIGRGRSPKQVMSVGQSLIDEGSASNLIDAALQLDEGTSARKAAQTIVDRGMQSSALDIGNLAYMYSSETGDAEYIYGLDEPTVEETQNEPVATDINEAQDSRAVDLLTVAEEAVQRQNKPVSADIGNPISETVSAVEEQTAADEVRPGETAVMPKAKTPGLLRKYSQDAFKRLPRDVQKKSRDQFYALDLIAKKYGVTIEVVDSIDMRDVSGEVKRSAANGLFDPRTGRLKIALDALDNAYMFFGMHELTHYVQQYNADEYAILEDIVLDSLGADTVNEAIKHQMSINKGLTEAQARAEVVANSVGAILTDEQTVQRLVGEQRSLAQRIVDFIKKLVADLKEIAQNLSRRKSFEQIESLSKDIETLQSIADAFESALEGASRNVNAAAETETETETETQYSTKPQVDSEGNELSTQQAEFFKNSKAVDANGNLLRLYHGSSSYQKYEVFKTTEDYRQGLYLATNKDVAKIFANARNTADTNDFTLGNADDVGGSKGVYILYANVLNPLILDADGRRYDALDNALGIPGHNTLDTQQVVRYARENGYDGAIIKNVRESIGVLTDDVVVFNPNAVKYVDNKTPTGSPDIRYSTKDSDTTDGGDDGDDQSDLYDMMFGEHERPKFTSNVVTETQKEQTPKRIRQKITFSTDPKWLENQYYKLSKENAQLKTVVENLRKEFKLTAKGEYKADRKSVKALAQKFVQEVYSDYDVETLTDELTPLYEKLGRMTQDDWANADIDALIAPFINISANVLQMQSSDIVTGVADEIRGMIEYIKKSKITVSSDSEIESAESVRAFRQATGGNIKVVKGDVMRDGGVSAYEFIVGFAEEYPGIVPEDIMYGHTSEILNWLAEYVQYEPDYRYLGTDEQLREEATTRAFDLYLAFNTDVKQYKTFADVKKEQRDRLRKQYQDAMKKLKIRMDEKRDAALAKQKKAFDKAMDKAKAEHSAKIAELSKQYAKEKDKAVKAALREQYLELTRLKNAERYFERRAFEEWKIGDKRERKRRQERNKYIKHIKKISNELATWVNNPTKDHHVPMFLQGPLFDVLNNISQSADPDTSTEKNWQVKLYNLASAANKAVNGKMADEQRTELYDLLPDDIKAELDGLYSTLSTRKEAAEMSGKQIVTLMNNDELGTLYNILKTMRHVIVNINKLHKNTQYKEVKALGDQTIVDAQAFPMAKYGNMASRLLKFDMADAYSYFHQLGKSGDSIIKAISDGQEQKFSRVKEASEFFAAALKKHGIKRGDISKWRSTAHTFKLESGKTVTMTTAHIMELYASMRREQAVKHILGGGIEIDASAGDMRDAIKNRQVGSYKVTSEDVSTMLSKLTAGQKAFMEELQSFLSTTVAEWGNETSMELYGYQKFTEDSYWPIRVTKANIELKDPDKVRAVNAIANAGFTKPTNFYASNPLVLGDPIQKFSGHVSEMAAYNGLAAPIQDAMKWVNYVQRDSKGKPIYNNSVKLMLDKVYGVGGLAYFTNLIKDINGLSQAGYSTEIPRAWTARFKRAAIAGNIRVVIQQPTAILRALSMIDGKYMVMGAVGGANIKEMQEHSPIAWWKSNGHFDIGIGRGDYSIITGDESWSRRFTGEFMKPAGWADDIAWGLLWNAVKAEIRDTKPDMKDGSEEFFKAVSSRFSDIVNRTQVVDTVLHRSQAMRSKDLLMGMATSFMSEPTKQFNMLRTAFIDAKRGNYSASAKKQLLRTIFSMALAAGMNGLVKSLWDAARKREKDEDYWKKFVEVLGQNMLDEAILDLPFLKDAISIIQGYDVERLDLSAFGDLWASLNSIYKYIEQGASKKSMYKLFADLVKSVSSMTGLPFRGLLTSFESVLNMFAPEALTAKYETVKNLYDAYRTGDKKVAAELYNAILSENIKKIENAEKERKKEGEIPVYADAESIRVGAMEQIDSALAKLLAEEPEIAEAYGYRKAGQAKKLDAIYEKLLAQGFTRNTITQAINRYQNIVEKSQPETDEYSEKKRYKNEHLFTAIRGAVSSGNYSDVALIYDELLKTSSAKDPKKAIRNEVTQEFKAEYVSYFDSGNSSKAQSLAKVLKTHFGYEDEDFAKWVMDDKSDKMRDAINSGDAKTANKYIQRQLQLGRDAEDIAQSVTAKYKAEIIDAFIANDKTKLQALFGTLAALSLTDKKGNPYYTWDRVWGWIENYLENPE